MKGLLGDGGGRGDGTRGWAPRAWFQLPQARMAEKEPRPGLASVRPLLTTSCEALSKFLNLSRASGISSVNSKEIPGIPNLPRWL